MIEWDRTFRVFVPEMDIHHRYLLDLMNELCDGMRKKISREAIGLHFETILDYAKRHFEAEEEMLENHDYPNLNSQKMQHTKFINDIKDLQAKYESGDPTVFISLVNQLSDWFIHHIRNMDKQYGIYFLKNNITPKFLVKNLI